MPDADPIRSSAPPGHPRAARRFNPYAIMNAYPLRWLITMAAFAAVTVAACKKPNVPENHGGKGTTPPTGPILSEDGLRALLVKGYAIYWSVPELGTNERTTIGAEAMMRLDPVKVPSIKALRARLSAVFIGSAVDSVLADFGVREHEGKLWMFEAAGGDVSSFEDADIVHLKQDSTRATAVVEVPLGDSGQVDELTVRAVYVGGLWKLATDPYGAGDADEEDVADDSTGMR